MGAIRTVELSALNADPTYQRAVKSRHRKIAADFDADALGVPLVAERPDLSLWIVDGLQRVEALRRREAKRVRVEIVKTLGPDDEARLFRRVNAGRTQLTAEELFRSALTAGDGTAKATEAAVNAAGFRLGWKKLHGWPHLSCFRALYTLVGSRGTEPLMFALGVIREAWAGDPLAVYDSFVVGLATFHGNNKGAVDRDRLTRKLKKIAPARLLHSSQLGTGDRFTAMARELDAIYHGRGKKAAAPPDGS